AAGGDLPPVQLNEEPPGGDDLLDRRGVHQRQGGMGVPQRLVMVGPAAGGERRQVLAAEESKGGGGMAGRGGPPLPWGPRGCMADEGAPAFLGGQRVVGRDVVVDHGGAGHIHFSASAWASKIPKGTTVAAVSSGESVSSSGAGSGWGGRCVVAATLVRATMR